MKIPVMEGRDFSAQDDLNTAPVMIANQSFQRRFFGAGPVAGRKVRARCAWFTVAGLVRDSKYRRLTEGPTPYLYTAARQTSGGEFPHRICLPGHAATSAVRQLVRTIIAQMDGEAQLAPGDGHADG